MRFQCISRIVRSHSWFNLPSGFDSSSTESNPDTCAKNLSNAGLHFGSSVTRKRGSKMSERVKFVGCDSKSYCSSSRGRTWKLRICERHRTHAALEWSNGSRRRRGCDSRSIWPNHPILSLIFRKWTVYTLLCSFWMISTVQSVRRWSRRNIFPS